MTVRKVTRRQAAREINMMRDFRTTTGSHRGENVKGDGQHSLPSNTQLPESLWSEFQNSHAEYIVWSYDTPIAWWTPTVKGGPKETHGWVIPDVTYSPTTSRYQSACNLAAHLSTNDPYWGMFND